MNGTTCPPVTLRFSGRFLPPVYIVVFIIGLTANGVGLKCLLQNWKRLKIINVFVLNFGLANILYLLTLPFLVVYHFMKNKWIFGDTFCKMTRFFFNMNLYGSIGFLTCISVSRYLAVVHPVRVMGRLKVSHSLAVSVFVWLSVGAQSLPDMFYPKTYNKRLRLKCFDTTNDAFMEDYLKYSVGRAIVGFCLPFLITVGCYIHVIVTLCIFSSSDRQLKQRSYKLLLVLLLLFSVCYIPYHVLRNLNLWCRVLQRRGQCYGWFNAVYVAQQISRGLVSLNSALNPSVYLYVSEELSSQLQTLLSRTKLWLRFEFTSAADESSVQELHSRKKSSFPGHAPAVQPRATEQV